MKANLDRYGIGAGAGAAAALLFLAATRGAPLGVALGLSRPAAADDRDAGMGLGRRPGRAVYGLRARRRRLARLRAGLWPASRGTRVGFGGFCRKSRRFTSEKSADPRRRASIPGPGAVALLAAALFILAGVAQLSLMWFATGGYDAAVAALAGEIRAALDASGAARALPPDINRRPARGSLRAVRARRAIDRRDADVARQPLSRRAFRATLATAQPAVARHSDRLSPAALVSRSDCDRAGIWRLFGPSPAGRLRPGSHRRAWRPLCDAGTCRRCMRSPAAPRHGRSCWRRSISPARRRRNGCCRR